MKRFLCAFLTLFLLLSLCSCSPEPGDIRNARIDYGISEKYTKESIDSAIQVILDEFITWNDCALHTIKYAGDEACDEDELDYCNSLSSDKEFDECIVFTSSFFTGKNCDNGFNSNEEYIDFEWHLARRTDGNWELVTWGY